MELCLFEGSGEDFTETRLELTEVDAHVWHCYLPQVQPASATATACTAPGRPSRACAATPTSCCSTHYAKATTHEIDWDPSLFAYEFGDEESRNDDDSAAHMMLGVVINPFFDWEGDRKPHVPYNETVIYEAHVKGLTELHPDVPEALRGTYAGLAHPSVTSHLKRLGVTAIELMPVHQFIQDNTLLEKGLRNYWGYNTLAFLAPTPTTPPPRATSTAAGCRCRSSRPWSSHARRGHRGHPRRRLQPHRRGQPPRPTLSFKGIDNQATTAWSRTTSATTWTTRAPATASTCATPTRCS